MSIQHSLASKARWANIPAEERTKIMTERAKSKWSKVSPQERRKHALKMVNARKQKD